MRGYNDSERPQGVAAYRLEQLAADVHAAVSALGHKRCTLVAHDWGGSVAWAVRNARGAGGGEGGSGPARAAVCARGTCTTR